MSACIAIAANSSRSRISIVDVSAIPSLPLTKSGKRKSGKRKADGPDPLRRLGAPTRRGRLPICCSCRMATFLSPNPLAIGTSAGYSPPAQALQGVRLPDRAPFFVVAMAPSPLSDGRQRPGRDCLARYRGGGMACRPSIRPRGVCRPWQDRRELLGDVAVVIGAGSWPCSYPAPARRARAA